MREMKSSDKEFFIAFKSHLNSRTWISVESFDINGSLKLSMTDFYDKIENLSQADEKFGYFNGE